jgi:hypothetical protein
MRLCFLGEGGAELIEKTFQTHTGQKKTPSAKSTKLLQTDTTLNKMAVIIDKPRFFPISFSQKNIAMIDLMDLHGEKNKQNTTLFFAGYKNPKSIRIIDITTKTSSLIICSQTTHIQSYDIHTINCNHM